MELLKPPQAGPRRKADLRMTLLDLLNKSEQLEEVQVLFMPMLSVAIPGYFAARAINGSEEGGSAMPLVLVSRRSD
jgi:hypothetical protein